MKLNEKYVQTKLIKGFSQFNYIGEVFEVKEINEGIAILRNNKYGVGCGADEQVLNECFKLYVSDIEKTCNEENIKLIFNNNATIAILNTGEKGISKCLECDIYNKEKGIEIAVIKAKIKQLKKKLKQLSK